MSGQTAISVRSNGTLTMGIGYHKMIRDINLTTV